MWPLSWVPREVEWYSWKWRRRPGLLKEGSSAVLPPFLPALSHEAGSLCRLLDWVLGLVSQSLTVPGSLTRQLRRLWGHWPDYGT